MNSRKNLHRLSCGQYAVDGPQGRVLIIRQGRRGFETRQRWGTKAAFWKLLRDARAYAEHVVGGGMNRTVFFEPEYPYDDVPVFLRKWRPGERIGV